MVWAAMGWDWKSELVLLERLDGKKEIRSTTYTN